LDYSYLVSQYHNLSNLFYKKFVKKSTISNKKTPIFGVLYVFMKVYSLFHGTEKGNDKGRQFPHKREEEDLGKSVSLLDKNQEERRNQRRV
jgi:hypothetical protein